MSHQEMKAHLPKISLSILVTMPLLFPALYSILPALGQRSLGDYTTNPEGLKLGSLNFANDIVNGSSVFGATGLSMIKGIKVTGINLLPNNEVSIILRHTDPVIFQQNTSSPRSVTVMVLRVPMSLQNLTTMAFAQADKFVNNSNTYNINNTLTNVLSPANFALQPTGIENATSLTNNINPLSFIKNIQIGSSTVIKLDSMDPQIVRIPLFGTEKNTFISTADFVVIAVIPHSDN
jgi:hypothetical protein